MVQGFKLGETSGLRTFGLNGNLDTPSHRIGHGTSAMEISRGLSVATKSLCRSTTSSFLASFTSPSKTPTRSFSSIPVLFAPRGTSAKGKQAKEKMRRRKKKHQFYKQYDLKEMQQFTLCEAMRCVDMHSITECFELIINSYIKAMEVTRDPEVPKYDIHIKLRTKKDGPIIRNQIRLPYAVKTDIKVAVICPPDSPAAKQALEAGAAFVGEEEIFQRVKDGKIDFDRCLAVPASLPKLAKEGLPRILGPRGLMPSAKLGTVVEKPGTAVRNMLGGSMYRERSGVVRMAVGRLTFTPEQLRDNVKAYISAVKKDATALSDQIVKEVAEVVSQSRSPLFDDTDFWAGPELDKFAWLLIEWRVLQGESRGANTSRVGCGVRDQPERHHVCAGSLCGLACWYGAVAFANL